MSLRATVREKLPVQIPDQAISFEKILSDAVEARGRANIITAGKTGVGKSTLINSVFQAELAATGQGRPVTMETREIFKEGIPVSIFDTRGLEAARFQTIIGELEKYIIERAKSPDINDHIHIAWLCISEDSRRVEDADRLIAEMLVKHMPLLCVITKARADQNFARDVQQLVPEARNVIRCRALPEQFDDGHVLPPFGLAELVEATVELLPEAHRNAFVAAQKVNLKQKISRAHKVVAASAATAAGIGAVPIPFADAALLVPLQVAMLAKITTIFGLPTETALLSTIVSGSITGSGATMLGRAAVGGLLKLIPGAGSVVGGLVSGGTAAILTTGFGEAYVAALTRLMEKYPDHAPSASEIASTFRDMLSTQAKLLT